MTRNWKPRKILVKFFKILGWIALSIVLLLILVALAIQIPAVQNKLTQKAIAFLEDKIGTEVDLKKISLAFPKKIVLTGLYLEDQSKDTLLYVGRLGVNTDLWGLTRNEIQLNKIELEDLTASVTRSKTDSAFNFDYIIKAFADTTATVDTTAQAWNFSVGTIALDKISLSFKDALEGNDVSLKLGTFELSTDEFDLNKSLIKLDEINLSNVQAVVTQTKVQEMSADSVDVIAAEPDTLPYDIGFNQINLQDIQVAYTHHGTGQSINLTLDEAALEANDIDLKNQVIDLDKFLLANTFIAYQQMSGKEKVKEQAPRTTEDQKLEKIEDENKSDVKPWLISLNELDLSGNTIQYHDFNQPFQKGAVDFNHLWISDLNTEAKNIRVNGMAMQADLVDLAFREKSGFVIESFGASVAVEDNDLHVDNFVFNSTNSKIEMDMSAQYASLENIADTYPNTTINLNIKSSTIALKDLLYFNPTLLDSLGLKIPPAADIHIDALVNGKVNNLNIDHLQLRTLGKTMINTHGTIRNLPDMNKARMDVTLDKFYTTRVDVERILPDTIIPAGIQVPEWINLAAKFKGTMQTPDLRSTLTTNLGAVKLDAKMNLDSTIKENYSADLAISQFDVGTLLKQPQNMGSLDMVASVKGAGLKIDNLDAVVKLVVNSFEYNGYQYKDFKIDGSMKKYLFSGIALMEDKNLDLKLEGDLDYNEEVPHYEFKFELKNADFNALKLIPRPLKAKGTIDVNLSTPDFKAYNGHVNIRNFGVYNGEALYMIDSLLFASIDQKGKSEISIKSDILDGDFKGTINLFSMGDVIQRHFNKYFSLRDTLYKEAVAPQDFEFNLVLKNTDLLTEVVLPGLEPFVPGEIAGKFDSEANQMNLSFNLSKINYGGVSLDSIAFKVLSDSQSLDYTFALKEISMDTMHISTMRIAGNVMNDSIRTHFMIMDSLEQEKYFLGGVFNSFEDAFQFRLLPGQVLLNYEHWKTPKYNTLRFTDTGMQPNNFWISKGESRVLMLKNDAASTLSIMFNQFSLRDITSLIEGNTPVEGLMNGDLNIGVADNAAFNSNLTIKELKVLEQMWGDLMVQLGQTQTGPFNVDVQLEGENVEMHAGGYFTDAPSSEVHFTAAIPRLNLAIVEPLSMGQLKNVDGRLRAEVRVEGKSDDPVIEGEVMFDSARFTSTYVNSTFTINDETIRLSNDRIAFNNFELRDQRNNIAKIDGAITLGLQEGLGLDLTLNAQDFQLLNSTEEDNELFYGNVRVTANAKVTGNSNLPKVDMDVSLGDESVFTFVVPQSEKGVMEQKGIVVFIDKDAKNDPFMEGIKPSDTVTADFGGIDLSANIELTGAETFNIIIDPATGDQLSVKGTATLVLDMDPTGDMQLTGRYEITEGTYDMSFYKLVKRNFRISKGSSIVWAGDPLDGRMDIRAIYDVETSPVELFVNQINDPAELNAYKERLPFMVYLNLKGEIMSPEISFELDMPQDEQNAMGGAVYVRIKDINTRESDLNKQVFALIILKRFISDNPLDNNAGGGTEGAVRTSVSKILSDQLNRLSENVKGVELSFDVKSYEDYSSGQSEDNTELQLGVSKSLLNDRLVVKVSGNVGLEGEETTNQSSFADFIGDLALEYKLTEDGRIRITGFRNSNYDMIDGELIETGAGLIYIKDYNSLRELFKANEKNK